MGAHSKSSVIVQMDNEESLNQGNRGDRVEAGVKEVSRMKNGENLIKIGYIRMFSILGFTL